MTDPRTPDDDLGADSFDGLDLDSLTDGVHAGAGQWATISATATHRRHRRSWVIAAAAVLVLVLGSAAVVVSRGGDRSVGVTTDKPGGGAPDGRYVLPPAAATDILIRSPEAGRSSITFVVDGRLYALSQTDGPPETTDGTTFLEGLEPGTNQYNGTSVDLTGVGKVFLGCSGTSERPPGDPRMYYEGATWVVGDRMIYLTPLNPDGNPTDCGWPDLPDDVAGSQRLNQVMVETVASMRLVDSASWQTFVTDHGWVEPSSDPVAPDDTMPAVIAAMSPYALPPANATDVEGVVVGDYLVIRFALADGTRMHLSRAPLAPGYRASGHDLQTLLGIGEAGHPQIQRLDSDTFGTVYLGCGGGAGFGGNTGIDNWDFTTSAEASWVQDGHIVELSLDGPTQYAGASGPDLQPEFRCPIPSQERIVRDALQSLRLVDRAELDTALNAMPLTVGREGRAIAQPGE